MPIDEDDISLLFEDIHRGRSLIPPYPVPTRPTLIRWDPALPLGIENCAVMEWGEAESHMKECFGVSGKDEVEVDAALKRRPEDVWGPEVVSVWERRRAEVRRQREWVM